MKREEEIKIMRRSANQHLKEWKKYPMKTKKKQKVVKFKHDTTHIHELIILAATLNFQLRKAEETRKQISLLSLKLKR